MVASARIANEQKKKVTKGLTKKMIKNTRKTKCTRESNKGGGDKKEKKGFPGTPIAKGFLLLNNHAEHGSIRTESLQLQYEKKPKEKTSRNPTLMIKIEVQWVKLNNKNLVKKEDADSNGSKSKNTVKIGQDVFEQHSADEITDTTMGSNSDDDEKPSGNFDEDEDEKTKIKASTIRVKKPSQRRQRCFTVQFDTLDLHNDSLIDGDKEEDASEQPATTRVENEKIPPSHHRRHHKSSSKKHKKKSGAKSSSSSSSSSASSSGGWQRSRRTACPTRSSASRRWCPGPFSPPGWSSRRTAWSPAPT